MSEVTEKIKQELLLRCEKSKEKKGYDFWEEHIKYVVENAVELAKKYEADVEIVELRSVTSRYSNAIRIWTKRRT